MTTRAELSNDVILLNDTSSEFTSRAHRVKLANQYNAIEKELVEKYGLKEADLDYANIYTTIARIDLDEAGRKKVVTACELQDELNRAAAQIEHYKKLIKTVDAKCNLNAVVKEVEVYVNNPVDPKSLVAKVKAAVSNAFNSVEDWAVKASLEKHLKNLAALEANPADLVKPKGLEVLKAAIKDALLAVKYAFAALLLKAFEHKALTAGLAATTGALVFAGPQAAVAVAGVSTVAYASHKAVESYKAKKASAGKNAEEVAKKEELDKPAPNKP